MSAQKSSPSSTNQGYKRPYVRLYYVLLVLSTIGTFMSLTGVSSLPRVIEQFSEHPLYASIGLINLLVVLPVSIAALILLWRKHPDGIKLKLAAYAAAILLTFTGTFVTPQSSFEEATQATIENFERQGQSIDPEFARSLAETSFYGASWMLILSNIVFAHLWLKAWKQQIRADRKHEHKNHP